MREQGIDGWRELARRSQDDIGWFWDAVVRHLGIEFSTPYERVFDDSRGPMWTTWFGGGRINLTHNCVDRHARTTPDRIAVIAEGEDGEARTVTYAELGAMTNRLANALLARGVAAGVAARLADAGAVALITCDAVPRRGKPVAVKALADEALSAAPAVHTVIVHDRLGTEPPMQAGRDLAWAEAVDRQSRELDAPALDPETPMMVIYTSGTTGRPKGAVHVHGGFLVKIAQECAFQTDVHADDRFTWMTDMGWIMGPLIVVGGEGRCPIINLSGGTEVGACFLSPMPVMPLKECTLGAPSLGMAMDVVDADGNHVPAGSVGELVCRKPWPSMTRGVWGDPDRY